MSANGKKWSQFAEATSLVDGDKLLARDVSEAAADQIKEITKANLSDTLGVAGHLSDPTLHMTKGEINDRHLNKAPSNAIVGDGVDDYVSLNSSLLQFGDSLSDIPCGESAIIEIDDLGSIFVISAKATGSAPNNERTFTVKTDGKLEIKLFDSSTAVYIGQTGNTVLVVGRRYHVAWTYDGSGTSAGIKLYVNGVAETLTLTELGSYTAMHASGASAYLFRFSANYGQGKIYSYVPWNREPAADDVALLASNGNQPEPADQWGNSSELLTDPGFEDWSSGSNLASWTEGSSITIAQDGTNKYSGSYACHYTSSGLTIASGVFHQLRQGSIVPLGWHRVSVVVKNASAGDLDVGVNNDRWVTFDGTSLTDRSSEVISQYPGSELRSYELTDLGSGWYRIDLVFKLVASSARDFVLGGTGQWYIDDASCKRAGAIASHQGRNLESDAWVDESTNEINGTLLGGATRLFEPHAQMSGQFTPIFKFGGTTQTMGTSAGFWWRYADNPDLIFFTIRIASPAAVSDVGNAVIEGLPFNSINDATQRFAVIAWPTGMTGLTGGVSALVFNNDDTVGLYQSSATGDVPLTNSEFTTSSDIQVTGFYKRA